MTSFHIRQQQLTRLIYAHPAILVIEIGGYLTNYLKEFRGTERYFVRRIAQIKGMQQGYAIWGVIVLQGEYEMTK